MRFSDYARLEDGYRAPIGPSTKIGPEFSGTSPSLGYSVTKSFTSKPIDVGNIQQFGATCAFLSGSTLAGTLELQVCNNPNAPDGSQYPDTTAEWVVITAPTTSVVSITSGAKNIVYDYPLIGARWIRFSFTYSSGSGLVSFPYTVKSS